MLTVENVKELISMTIQDAPPSLKKLFCEAARMDATDTIHRRLKMKKCKHKFQPRYNRKWSTDVNDVVKHCGHAKGLYGEPYLKEETYIHDICVKCGEIKC